MRPCTGNSLTLSSFYPPNGHAILDVESGERAPIRPPIQLSHCIPQSRDSYAAARSIPLKRPHSHYAIMPPDARRIDPGAAVFNGRRFLTLF